MLSQVGLSVCRIMTKKFNLFMAEKIKPEQIVMSGLKRIVLSINTKQASLVQALTDTTSGDEDGIQILACKARTK